MLVTLTSLPQVLFAKHWYCPPSALVILVMFSHLSWLISPPPIFDHVTNGAGNPITMQFKDTPSPSLTVLLSTWFIDAGTNKIIYNISFYCATTITGATYKVHQSDCRKIWIYSDRHDLLNPRRKAAIFCYILLYSCWSMIGTLIMNS